MSEEIREQPQLEALPEPEGPQTMLVIAAHHDDIEFGMAGSVARWTEAGHTVHYVVITDGGAGSNEPGVVRAELAETRRAEQIAAAEAVGVTDVRFLDYPDGVLQPTMELRRDLTRIIRELKPYRVACQDPTTIFAGDFYINHPDHRAAGEAAIYAVFPSSESRPIFPELLAEGYEPHKVTELVMTLTMKPTHYVDIGPTIDKKIASLRCHASQIGAGEDADNGALKWIRERNGEGGKQVGVDYAEHFRRMVFVRPQADEDANEPAETETVASGE